MRSIKIRIFLPIILGIVTGYLVLHPASIYITNVFKSETISLLGAIKNSFLIIHLHMSIFFMVLGGINGLIFTIYFNMANKFYFELKDINIQLKENNNKLMESLSTTSKDVTIFMKQLWPTLNKIQTSINLVDNDYSKADKSVLIAITKENIKNLFELINIMLPGEKNE